MNMADEEMIRPYSRCNSSFSRCSSCVENSEIESNTSCSPHLWKHLPMLSHVASPLECSVTGNDLSPAIPYVLKTSGRLPELTIEQVDEVIKPLSENQNPTSCSQKPSSEMREELDEEESSEVSQILCNMSQIFLETQEFASDKKIDEDNDITETTLSPDFSQQKVNADADTCLPSNTEHMTSYQSCRSNISSEKNVDVTAIPDSQHSTPNNSEANSMATSLTSTAKPTELKSCFISPKYLENSQLESQNEKLLASSNAVKIFSPIVIKSDKQEKKPMKMTCETTNENNQKSIEKSQDDDILSDDSQITVDVSLLNDPNHFLSKESTFRTIVDHQSKRTKSNQSVENDSFEDEQNHRKDTLHNNASMFDNATDEYVPCFKTQEQVTSATSKNASDITEQKHCNASPDFKCDSSIESQIAQIDLSSSQVHFSNLKRSITKEVQEPQASALESQKVAANDIEINSNNYNDVSDTQETIDVSLNQKNPRNNFQSPEHCLNKSKASLDKMKTLKQVKKLSPSLNLRNTPERRRLRQAAPNCCNKTNNYNLNKIEGEKVPKFSNNSSKNVDTDLDVICDEENSSDYASPSQSLLKKMPFLQRQPVSVTDGNTTSVPLQNKTNISVKRTRGRRPRSSLSGHSSSSENSSASTTKVTTSQYKRESNKLLEKHEQEMNVINNTEKRLLKAKQLLLCAQHDKDYRGIDSCQKTVLALQRLLQGLQENHRKESSDLVESHQNSLNTDKRTSITEQINLLKARQQRLLQLFSLFNHIAGFMKTADNKVDSQEPPVKKSRLDQSRSGGRESVTKQKNKSKVQEIEKKKKANEIAKDLTNDRIFNQNLLKKRAKVKEENTGLKKSKNKSLNFVEKSEHDVMSVTSKQLNSSEQIESRRKNVDTLHAVNNKTLETCANKSSMNTGSHKIDDNKTTNKSMAISSRALNNLMTTNANTASTVPDCQIVRVTKAPKFNTPAVIVRPANMSENLPTIHGEKTRHNFTVRRSMPAAVANASLLSPTNSIEVSAANKILPSIVTSSKTGYQLLPSKSELPESFPSLKDLICAEVLKPGLNVLTLHTPTRTVYGSLTTCGKIKTDSGYMYDSPTTWCTAFNNVPTSKPSHTYNAVMYMGKPLAEFKLPPKENVERFGLKKLLTKPELSGPSDPLKETLFDERCTVRIHSTSELQPSRLLFPDGFHASTVPEEIWSFIKEW